MLLLFQFSSDLATMKPHKQPRSTISVSLLTLMLLCKLSVVWACPSSECSCEINKGRYIVQCNGRGLTAIPKFKSEDTTYDELTLANNDINSLPNDAFKGLKIKYLDLSNNQISTIDSGAFNGLGALTTKLVLHVNQMTQFPTSALSTLANLQLLELKGFAMTSLPENALAGLSKLQILSLKSCGLVDVSSSDLTNQQSTLSELNLLANALTSVPTAAIASLPNLASLNLAGNKIGAINSGDFVGVAKLKKLDLASNGVRTIHENGFTALTNTLLELRLQRNHLHDREILPLNQLGQLRILDLAYNGITNIPSELFTNMKYLEEADFTKNNLSNIKKSMFQGLDDSVKILKFAENQIAEIESGAFEQLHVLEELHLDEQPDLSGVLNADTFGGLEHSLKVLNLNNVKFSTSNWPTVHSLVGLQLLKLAHNNIDNVPDSTFLRLSGLAKLYLSYNKIASVSQAAVNGLQTSLKLIDLSNNQITSLDKCVFYQFDNLATIELKANPLNCDCRLRWLQKWVETKYDTFTLLSVTWKCASPSEHANVLFRTLSSSDLTCDSSTSTPATCQDLRTTTTTTGTAPSTTTTPAPHQVSPTTLFINITDVKDTSMTVTWFVNGTEGITGFTVEHQVLNTEIPPEKTTYPPDARRCPVTGLEASTPYMVCVTLWYSGSIDRQSQKACEDIITKVPMMHVIGEDSSRMQIILGSILGVLVLIVIVGVIIMLIMRHRRRREPSFFSTSTDSAGLPRARVGYNSRRFSKPKTNTMDIDNQSNIQLEKKLEGFSQEERDRILSVLTQPRECPNTSRTSDSSQRYVPELPPRNTTTDGYLNPVSLRDEQDPHIYFEIPADSIPTEEYI